MKMILKLASIMAVILSLSPLAWAENIMWWNTGRGGKGIYGTFENEKAKKTNIKFNQSLTHIILTERPEIAVLGECMPDTISSNNWQEIRKQYSFVKFIPYNQRELNWGILILSKIEPSSLTIGVLDYVPVSKTHEQNKKADAQYRQAWLKGLVGDPNEKPFIQMIVSMAGREIALYPLHFMQPWQQIIDQQGYTAFISEMYFGNENPLMNQMAHFFQQKADPHHPMVADGSLMFGDFNCPDTFLGNSSLCFKLWDWQYRDLTIESFSTYPAPYAYLQLDHAFADRQFDLNAVANRLTLHGSDHYPLMIRINND